MKQPETRVRLTAGRVGAFTCPGQKSQVFLWDTDSPALALRVTPTGRKTYVFEARLNGGATVRITIGTVADWPIELARAKARELKILVDNGHDPRDVERARLALAIEAKAATLARIDSDQVSGIMVQTVWDTYVDERRPHWGDLHYRDHLRKAAAGGKPAKRGTRGRGVTIPGPLYSLMALPLRSLDAATVEAWAANEGKTRPSSARLAWRCLKVFLGWCSEHPTYAQLLPDKNPAKTKKSREFLGKAGVKSDVLQKEQLAPWFAAVEELSNPVIAACLQVMLLTGARPGEVLSLRWEDINTQWKGINIRDKVEGNREIPATPYVLHLLSALPRRNQWVFGSATSASGHLVEPNFPHTRACRTAGLANLTLHGLRRSFKSLTEWLEVPVGVVAQIQGHKPSATAEKHYTIRPLELLRVHHERIEAWILKEAKVPFKRKMSTPKTKLGVLRLTA